MAGLAAFFVIFHLPQFQNKNGQLAAIAVLLTTLSAFVVFSASRSGFGATIFILLWLFVTLPRYIPHIFAAALGTVPLSNVLIFW